MTQPRTSIRIQPIPDDFLARARSKAVDALGQPVKRLVASGGEPCRDALRRAAPGEPLILASFSPFSKPGPYHEFGPVFILENADAEPPRHDALPRVGAPDNYLREQFVIRAYSADEEILDAAMTQAGDIGDTIDRLFDSPATAFLHVRFPTYGCFAMRIDRA